MKKNMGIMTIVVLAVVMVGIGEASIYFANPYSYGSDVGIGQYSADYSLEAPGRTEYNVISFDNHGVSPVEELIICLDGTSFYVSIKNELELRGFTNVILAEPEELAAYMGGDASGRAILFPSGLFPEEVYDGSASDPLFADWLDEGGSVYWFGCSEIPDDAYLSAFGLTSDSFNVHSVPESVSRSGEICTQLCLRSSNVYHGLRSDIGTPLAYVSESGFSSITAMRASEGTMVVMGGDMGDDHASDCAQMIAAGITYATTVLDHAEGMADGSASGEMTYSASAAENVTVYVHMGGYYTVYGERFGYGT
ncbi:MAG: hypothetical protein WCR09_04525 [Candidatus Methanomethylophilaceae archaeon]